MTPEQFAANEKARMLEESASRLRQKSGFAKETLSDRIKFVLKKQKRQWSIEELSDVLDVACGKVRLALEELHDAGMNVKLKGHSVELVRDGIAPNPPTIIDTKKFKGKEIVFGVTSDNHLGSKYERLDVLNALYDIWEDQGVEVVYQGGNMIDGEATFNRHDLIVHGLEAQANYFVEHWPSRKNMVTRYVTGDDHEGWFTQREGVDVGRLLELYAKQAGRNDLQYLGHMEHDLELKADKGSAIIRVTHAGGGSAYATSYSAQKLAESLQGGEKPNVILIGHYHKAEYGYPREIHAVQMGCTEDQTPFMRKKRLAAHVGGWTIRFTQDEHGLLHGFTVTWHPFYDKDFYKGKGWKYRWR